MTGLMTWADCLMLDCLIVYKTYLSVSQELQVALNSPDSLILFLPEAGCKLPMKTFSM